MAEIKTLLYGIIKEQAEQKTTITKTITEQQALLTEQKAFITHMRAEDCKMTNPQNVTQLPDYDHGPAYKPA